MSQGLSQADLFSQALDHPKYGYNIDSFLHKGVLPSTVKLTDTSGAVTINFYDDDVTIIGPAGDASIDSMLVTDHAITNSILYEQATVSTKDILESSIKSSVLDAINKGLIQGTNSSAPYFTVNVDTNVTSNSISSTPYVTTFRILYNSNLKNLTAAEILNLQKQFAREAKRKRFRDQLRLQQAPAIINHRGSKIRALALPISSNFDNVNDNEIVALGLLKSMVDNDTFKKYLKHGIVSVNGSSGLTYQIQRKSHIIKVWHMGVNIANLCVYIKDQSIPPTDEIVAKMLICQYDEIDIWRRANITWKIKQANLIKSSDIMEHHLEELAIIYNGIRAA